MKSTTQQCTHHDSKPAYLVLFALLLIACTAKADENAWGATTSGSMVEIDATTGKLVSLTYNGQPYTNFILLDSVTKNPDPSLWIALNPSGTLYGLDSSGNLYTINTANLTQGANSSNIGFLATKGSSTGVSNPTGATFISATLLDISTSTILYSYNLTSKALTNLGSFTNANISGLAYNTALLRLFGVKYLPSSTGIDLISGVSLTGLPNSSASGLSQNSCLFAGATLLYLSDGSSSFYSYSTTSTTLTKLSSTLGSGLHSLTAISAGGSSGTPTPSPTPNPTPTPTPTPTPIVYSAPTGTLIVTAPETTPSGSPQCAPSWTYTASERSSFGSNPIDPNGKIGIYRYYQTTTDGTSYLPTTATAAVPASTVWQWPFANTNGPITYNAGQVGISFYYGREILQLVYTFGNGTITPLDTKTIYLYPWNYNSSATGPSPTAVFTNALTQTSAVSNPSPYATPSPTPSVFGDAPRFSVQMNDLYPVGTTSVIIYPGTAVSGSPSTAATIKNTTTTTPSLSVLQASGGLWPSAPSVTFETGPYITSTTSPQTYTIAAIQTLPSVYPLSATAPINPAVLNTFTFTISGFNVNGTVGTVK